MLDLPKKFFEQEMKDNTGGTWITLEESCEQNGVNLVSVGYKYNTNVLTFIMTRGARTTRHGEPYEAKFPDKFGNVCVRHIARPEIISNYFLYSNVVDLHNQGR